MGSNEEYLDKLLQSVTKDEKKVEAEEHEYSIDMTDDELLASLIDMYSEELADFKETEIIHKEESEVEETDTQLMEDVNLTESIADMPIGTELSDISDDEEQVSDMEESVSEYTSTDSDYMSQSEIEALLNGLQDEISEMEPDVVNANKIIEDFSADDDPVLEEVLSEPPVMDVEDIDILIPEKNDGFDVEAESDLLKEMGIDSMSAEQIDELLYAAAESEKVEDTADSDNNEMDLDALFGGLSFQDDFDPEHKASEEMADLLGGMLGGGNDDLAEINDLLMKAENNENMEASNLKNILNMDEDIGGNDLLNELLQADIGVTASDEESNSKEKSNKKKVKKEKIKKEKQPKEKKEGESFWKKITSILFEEEETLDDDKKVRIVDGDDLASLIDADENDKILNEMLNEDKKKGKKSKKKKADSKSSKEKKENSDLEDGEEVIDPKEQAKQAKLKEKAEKKAAKKKAKEEKAEADRVFLKAQPSISTKRSMVAIFFAMSLMAIILIIYIFVPDAISKANARKAFYNEEYYKAYELLQGKKLNDSDTILLNKVTCVLKMQRKLDAYNSYVKLDKNLEAINVLMEAVALYEECYGHAKALSVDEDINEIYDEILLILNGRYGVSEDMAKEINACVSDAEYTVRLYYLIEGKVWGEPETDESEKPMEDVLPEEEDFLEGQ